MTELQHALVDFVSVHVERHGKGPATAEVQHAFRFRNDTNVLRSLEHLAATRHLKCVGGRWEIREPGVQLHLGLANSADAPPR